MGLICTKCKDKALVVIEEFKDFALFEKVRILAGGREIYRGKYNQAKINEPVLLIGNCEYEYYKYHSARLRKMFNPSLISKYVYCLAGCPPNYADTKDAIKEFLSKGGSSTKKRGNYSKASKYVSVRNRGLQ